jgi:hypothetical protein
MVGAKPGQKENSIVTGGNKSKTKIRETKGERVSKGEGIRGRLIIPRTTIIKLIRRSRNSEIVRYDNPEIIRIERATRSRQQ